MNIDDTTLDEAIVQHAVNLNRLGWLNQHTDIQRTVWKQLIHRHERTPGKLTLADFTEATCRLTVPGLESRPTHDIVPPMIVHYAVRIAAERHERARLNVEQHDDFWLKVETNRLAEAIRTARRSRSVAEMNAAVQAAITQFHNDADNVRADLVGSGFDNDVVNAKLALIDRQEAKTLEMDPPELMWSPTRTSDDEIRELDRVWREGNK